MVDKVSYQILIDCIRARLAVGDQSLNRASVKNLIRHLMKLQDKAEQMVKQCEQQPWAAAERDHQI